MDDLSFTTYLKLTLLPTTQSRLGTLQRMMNSNSPFDFYKQMKFAAREVAKGELEPDVILSKLSAIKSSVEREHNLKMATNFLNWWNKQEDAKALSIRPSGIYKTEQMAFGIKMRPEFAFEQNGKRNVVYLWASKTPALSRQGVGAAIHLLKSQLAHGEFLEANFGVLNLRKGEFMTEKHITNQSQILADSDIAGINQLWKSFG